MDKILSDCVLVYSAKSIGCLKDVRDRQRVAQPDRLCRRWQGPVRLLLITHDVEDLKRTAWAQSSRAAGNRPLPILRWRAMILANSRKGMQERCAGFRGKTEPRTGRLCHT